MNDYDDLCNALRGMTKEVDESTWAALWGSINKDSVLATYLNSFYGKKTR